MKKNLAVIILAAGKSTRMKSACPKVIHPVCGRPMLGYVLDLARGLKPQKTICVLGYKQEAVRKIVGAGIKVVLQKRLLGTADALKMALPLLKGFGGTLLVLYGDTPLLTRETVVKLLDYHTKGGQSATLLTGQLEKPAGYGRVIRDKYGCISGIVEEKDADDFQKKIKEVNTGIICFDKKALSGVLGRIRPANRKKEYYLTDAISLLYKSGALVEAAKLADINEALGVNSRIDLAKVNMLMRCRINEILMRRGVSIIDPPSTFIDYGARIGGDTVIYPFTVIDSDVKIGSRCSIGPFAHLRQGSRIQDDVMIGNFLEVSRSKISSNTLVKHFCYIGDSLIGRGANIGAGTVTANFNGKKKNTTVIDSGALIGSDTVLVAPVKVGRKATTGAGAVVTKNVPAGVTVVGVPARIIRR